MTFEKAPPRRFALVVGADGLHSVVRRLAFAPEAECVRSFDLYNAWFTAPADFQLDGWFQMYNEPGGLVASARPGRRPDEIKAALAFRSGPLPFDRDPAAAKAEIARRFAGAGWQVPRLLDAMRDAHDFNFDSTGQVHIDRWWNGRVVLLGDAGYCPSPLSGLGTSLALVAAYVLAGELVGAGGEPGVAFPRYQERLRAYVAQAQELPPGGVGGYAPTSPFMLWLRPISMRWMTRWPMRPLIAGQFQKADAIDLPDYAGLDAAPPRQRSSAVA